MIILFIHLIKNIKNVKIFADKISKNQNSYSILNTYELGGIDLLKLFYQNKVRDFKLIFGVLGESLDNYLKIKKAN